MKHKAHGIGKYDKMDEITFDFDRKLPAVVVRESGPGRPARTKKGSCGSGSGCSGVDLLR